MTDTVLSLIGDTPLVRVRSFDTGPCELYLKLECQNPGGSIKDRIGLSMIEAAERSGRLQPGATIVEATAGNTGLGLALVAAQKGYRLILVVPDKMSREKILHLVALGADDVHWGANVLEGCGAPVNQEAAGRQLIFKIKAPQIFCMHAVGHASRIRIPRHEVGHRRALAHQIIADKS